MSTWIELGNLSDFPEDEAILVEDTKYGSLVVVFQNDSYFVLSGICSHEEFELGGSPVGDGEITCLLHMSCFKLNTGEVLNPPAEEPLETFETKTENQKLYMRQKS